MQTFYSFNNTAYESCFIIHLIFISFRLSGISVRSFEIDNLDPGKSYSVEVKTKISGAESISDTLMVTTSKLMNVIKYVSHY